MNNWKTRVKNHQTLSGQRLGECATLLLMAGRTAAAGQQDDAMVADAIAMATEAHRRLAQEAAAKLTPLEARQAAVESVWQSLRSARSARLGAVSDTLDRIGAYDAPSDPHPLYLVDLSLAAVSGFRFQLPAESYINGAA